MSSTQPSTMASMVVFFVCRLEELFVKMRKGNCRVYPYKESSAQKRTNKSIAQAATRGARLMAEYKACKFGIFFICLSYLSLVTKSCHSLHAWYLTVFAPFSAPGAKKIGKRGRLLGTTMLQERQFF